MGYEIIERMGAEMRHPTLRYPRRNPAGVVIVMPHHAADDDLPVEKLGRVHILPDSTRGKGPWPGPAYDYFLPKRQEIIYKLHELWEKGYHCGGGGMNTKALSICLEGNLDKEPPTIGQMDRLVWLTIKTNNEAGIERYIDWHDNYVATACPGKFFPREEYIRRVAAHYDEKPEPNPEPEPTPEPEPEEPPSKPEPPKKPIKPEEPPIEHEQPKGCFKTPALALFIISLLITLFI